MLTPPSQRAGRRGLSSPITLFSLTGPFQQSYRPNSSPALLVLPSSLSPSPLSQLPLLPTRLLLAIAASETAAAWCIISPSPWQLAYSLTQRDPYLSSAINQPLACVLGWRWESPLIPHAAGSLAATVPASLLGLSHAGSRHGRAAVCPLWHYVCTPQAKSNSLTKKQYQKAGGFPGFQAIWSHPHKPSMSWWSSSIEQGAESWANPQQTGIALD